jgi:hypothetical protein
MIVQHKPQLHLTYCLNVHPGESWAENFEAIKEKALAVKERVTPDQWFGLGLRLSAQAAQELNDPERRAEALDFFGANQLYPFTVNAFPHGRFHGSGVKEKVYEPDWRTDERVNYTVQVADVLASMLPDTIEGSISTVPGGFKPAIQSEDEKQAVTRNLAICVAYLSALRDDTGRTIHLGLEPEPDCFLETTPETIAFFKDYLLTSGVEEVSRILSCDRNAADEILRRHLGICFDTCHVAMQYEDLFESLRAYEAEGIRISKVQLSAAIEGASTPETWQALQSFCEPTYLHQVKGKAHDGGRVAWYDLPEALAELPEFNDIEKLRVHFHVPLFFTGAGPIQSTVTTLTPDFLHHLRSGVCPHIEIETYTFDVLPPEVNPGDIVRSVAREYSWVLSRIEGL